MLSTHTCVKLCVRTSAVFSTCLVHALNQTMSTSFPSIDSRLSIYLCILIWVLTICQMFNMAVNMTAEDAVSFPTCIPWTFSLFVGFLSTRICIILPEGIVQGSGKSPAHVAALHQWLIGISVYIPLLPQPSDGIALKHVVYGFPGLPLRIKI